MKHKVYENGDLKAVKVSKSKGNLVRLGPHHGQIVELSEDTTLWDVLKLKGHYDLENKQPKWVHQYFTLEDPQPQWDSNKACDELREKEYYRKVRARQKAYKDAFNAATERAEKEESQRLEKKYNRWYMRLYRHLTRKKIAKVRVLKE